MARRESEVRQEVVAFVELKTTKHYDAAVRLLSGLRKLAEFRDTQEDYRRRVESLCVRYKSRSAFVRRVRAAKLTDRDTFFSALAAASR